MLAELILGTLHLWSRDVASNCRLTASSRGTNPITICTTDSGVTISTADGQSTRSVEDVDDVLREAVLAGDPVWSPDASALALEVALDEEPGVLLVKIGSVSRVYFVDKALLNLELAGEGPAWSPDGAWLLFHTSGTGGNLALEGVYAYRMSDGKVYRLLLARVQSIAVSREYLYAIVRGENGKTTLRSYSLAELLRGASSIATSSSQRKRISSQH